MTSADAVLVAFLFVLGCFVGSFLNVVLYRLRVGLTVTNPSRSFCPHCKSPIAWYDNVPILSYAALGGRCRRCRERISWRYPVIEALTGLLFAALFLQLCVRGPHGDPGNAVAMMVLCSLLLVASAMDIECREIPDEITVFGLAGGLMASVLLPGLHVGSSVRHTFRALTGFAPVDGLAGGLIGAAAGYGLLLGAAYAGSKLFGRDAMGYGDVKLMAMVGAFLGWKGVVATFFLAPFFALAHAVPALLVTGDHTLFYGPGLSMGALVWILWHRPLLALLLLAR